MEEDEVTGDFAEGVLAGDESSDGTVATWNTLEQQLSGN